MTIIQNRGRFLPRFNSCKRWFLVLHYIQMQITGVFKMSKIALPHTHKENINLDFISSHISDLEDFRQAADIFKQLGDTSRLRIFWLLCHCEECVTNISALVNMTSPAVSHHLRQLKSSGLIVSHREGKEVYYKASDAEESRLLHLAIEKILEISCNK